MNPSLTCILFAAGIDWLETLLPFLFVGFWILSQVYAVFRRVAGGGDAGKGNGAGRVPPRPPAPPAAEPASPDELQKQIEEFLRQATGASSAPPKPRPVVQSKPTAPKPLVAPPTPPAHDAGLRPGTERHVGSLDIGKTEVARHVQDAFAHDLKHVRPGIEPAASALRTARPARPGQTAAQPPARQAARPASTRAAQTTAAELLQALRNPATFRQTILLREVLERPVDRW